MLADRTPENEELIVTGLLQQGTLFFPSESADSATPTAIFAGELFEPKDMKRSNNEIKAMRESLSTL